MNRADIAMTALLRNAALNVDGEEVGHWAKRAVELSQAAMVKVDEVGQALPKATAKLDSDGRSVE